MIAKKSPYTKMLASLIAIAALISCFNVKSEDSIFPEDEAQQMYDTTLLSQFVKIQKIVPLQTNEECLLPDIHKLIKSDSRYFMSSLTGTVQCFDEQGNYQGKIGNIGAAGNEYVMASDFDVTNHQVYVLTYEKIVIYDLQGKYLRTIPVSLNASNIKILPNGSILLFVLENDHVLHIINEQGTEISSTLSRSKALRSSRSNSFVPFNKKILFHKGYSNNLEVFNTGSNSFESTTLTDATNALTFDKLSLIMDSGNKKEMMNYQIFDGLAGSANQLMFASMKDNNTLLYTVDAESEKTCIFHVDKLTNDLTYTKPSSFFNSSAVAEKCLLTWVDPYMFREALEKAEAQYANTELHGRWVKMLEGIGEPANPIIIEYALDL